MYLFVSYLFILILSLAAACGADNPNKKQEVNTETNTTESVSPGNEKEIRNSNIQLEDTLYRISGTEPFWSFLVAKPQMVFTSAEGDTLLFPYEEPKSASARATDYLQVFNLGGVQQLILQKANQCPCSDGMSSKEYPYRAVLILKDKVLEGCGRTLP